jgi:hypothetical protein
MPRDMIGIEPVDISSPDVVRSRWIAELRRQGDRKCEGKLSDGHRVCALGLLSEVAGLRGYAAKSWGAIADAGGLNAMQMDHIWRMNDGNQIYSPPIHKHTFAEIADVVEGWFAP